MPVKLCNLFRTPLLGAALAFSSLIPAPPAQAESGGKALPPAARLQVQIVIPESAEKRAQRGAALKKFGRIPASYSLSLENLSEEIVIGADGDATVIHH